MRLKKLEIYGFKSFADRTELVFDQGITGIVGPNGSGKSNISDAVRWVLGEQSARSLRGGKMEDIIFNGTQTRKRLGYCEVTLVFDNVDQTLPVAFSEVQVTRRVYRSGESEYALNKTACRLKDIVDLFRDTGIGRDGYSLVSQGRIDEILSAKGEDRRQVFEEAAGIVKYKARKEEAERRMENTRQNLLRVQDIIDELANQLEPLMRQSETARRFLALREALRGLELNAFLVRSDRYAERIAKATESLDALAQAISQGEAKEQDGAQKRIAMEETLAALDKRITAAHEQVLDATRAQEVCEGENNVLRADLAHQRQEEARLTQEGRETAERLAALEQALAGSTGDQTGQQNTLDAQRAAWDEAEAQVTGLARQSEASEAALEEHKARIIAAMNRQSDVRAQQTRLATMRQALEKRLQEAHAAEPDLDAQAERLAQALAGAEQASRDVAEQMRVLQTQAEALDEQVRADAQRAQALSAGLAEQSGRQQALASRLRMLREMERDYQGYQHAVKQVLLHAKGAESGVHGVVATLLRVPKDLERAVEAVLGAALQHVVVQDEYVAKRMIGYLREKRYGRATFLPLTSVKGRTMGAEERALLAVPGCLGVASDLVAYDPMYRDIVENLLGRTVIAENLDVGIDIMRRGRHAFRLVTLEGDVMHAGGSMTGGSLQSRDTSLLSREREIAEQDAALAELARTIEKAKADLAALESARAGDKRRRAELYAALHQEEIAVAREGERLARARDEWQAHGQRAQQQRLACEQMTDNLRDIDAQLAELGGDQNSAAQDTETMQRQTQALQADLTRARAALDAVREAATAKRVAFATLEREIEALRRDASRLAAERQALATQQAQRQAQAQAAAARAAGLCDDLAAGEARWAALGARLAGANAALTALNLERGQAHAGLRAQGEELDSLRQRLADDVERHHRFELQIARLEAERKQLQDRIWEDYELTYAGALEHRQEGFELAAAERQIDDMRAQVRQMGSVNVNAIEDYRVCRARYDDLCTQREDLVKAQNDLQGIIEGLLVKMEKQFRERFVQLAEYFSQTFSRLFGGGYAELKLTDPADALGCDIEIVAQPPGKKLQLLTLLSGGERALTAIAILFAMLRLKPTPFCILDEIEAALDDANIGHFADFLAEFARQTQFVVVTHRKGTMERCDALYGVAMEEKGVSRMVSVQLTDTQTA